MKKMKSFLLTVLLLIGLYGCNKDQDFIIKDASKSQPNSASSTSIENAKAASSINNGFFPLFQLFLMKSNDECDAKVNAMIDHFFGTDDNKRLYFPGPNNTAYIKDVNNNDVRTEGMSYGMMITVQLDMKTEFDKLWAFANTYMKNGSSNPHPGVFRWRVTTAGATINNDYGPAPDGDQYFAAALYLAENRWGGGTYKTAADALLTAMNSNNFFANGNRVCFVPDISGVTDPSYHLPAFYELFAQYGPSNQQADWKARAKASRQFLMTTIAKSPYGLCPDYTDYSGNGTEANSSKNHKNFEFDAWRVAMNISLDETWWWRITQDDTQGGYVPVGSTNFGTVFSNKLLPFFINQGANYTNLFTINGAVANDENGNPGKDHSLGLVAMNACAARANTNLWSGILTAANDLWNSPLPTGQYRYYDGMLYMLAMLHSTGNYNIIDPGNTIRVLQFQTGSTTPTYSAVKLSSAWSGREITATGTQNDADVKGQPDTQGWSSQRWTIETVSGYNYVHLKNAWTNKYLNVQNQGENSRVVNYDLNNDWTSERWIIESVSGTNHVRFRNVWSGKYLTLDNTGDYSAIWSKTLNTGWASQEWILK